MKQALPMQGLEPAADTGDGSKRSAVVCLAAVVASLALQFALIRQQGLWADEIFSLAMATGHSLEHPSRLADFSLGDYVEATRPLPPSAYRAYTEHDRPPAGFGRVVRAVLLSDTSPPLYYLLLNLWTRALGTSDMSLRLFSVSWWATSLPLMWWIGRELGGRRAATSAVVLFAASPLAVFYATEGRMYSLLWFFTLSSALLTYRLHRRGSSSLNVCLWAIAAAGGLLTHYFFAFVWATFTAWLLLFPGRTRRATLIAAATTVAVLIAPWYLRLPESLSGWRVTEGWLELQPDDFGRPTALAKLAWSYVSPVGVWWSGRTRTGRVVSGGLAVLLAAAFGLSRWRVFWRRRVLMLWFWVLAAVLGLLVCDALRHTYTMAVPRYAIAGMPGAFLLIALALRTTRRPVGSILLALIVFAWVPSYYMLRKSESRSFTPFREVGRMVAGRAGPQDLLLVHSIPSGMAGIARYIPPHSDLEGGSGMTSWIERLGDRRVPDSLLELARGRRRILFVRIHHVAQPAPEEAWLRSHGRLVGEAKLWVATVLEFVPRDGSVFGPDHESIKVERPPPP
jgi:4-amino-4-deoxy-L-arabinose transferase-like glycosyltransferase